MVFVFVAEILISYFYANFKELFTSRLCFFLFFSGTVWSSINRILYIPSIGNYSFWFTFHPFFYYIRQWVSLPNCFIYFSIIQIFYHLFLPLFIIVYSYIFLINLINFIGKIIIAFVKLRIRFSKIYETIYVYLQIKLYYFFL